MKKILMLILLSFLLCGCAERVSYTVQPSAVPQKFITKTAIPPLEETGDISLPVSPDPWQYCADVTVSGISLQKVSDIEDEEFRRRVQITYSIQDADADSSFITDRCMNGKLYVCKIDPQTNCAEKLDFTMEPNDFMQGFCAEAEKEGAILSSIIVGYNSAFEWRCRDGNAVITGQIAEADADGYDKSIWVGIPAPIEIQN